jgi:hypothetical protein
MEILIGTPIHECKEYSIPRWLKSVSELQGDWFLYMVDNSDMPEFCERVKKYCDDVGLTKYELLHLENMAGLNSEARLAPSREKIREKFLNGPYEHWMSWECDVLIAPNALELMLEWAPRFDIINHNYPDRDFPLMEIGGMGCSIYSRKVVEKYSFLTNGGYGQCDKRLPNNYFSGDAYFIDRALWDGAKTVDFHNLFKTEHLGR